MSELRTPLEIAISNRDSEAVEQRLAAGDSPQDLNHLGIPSLYDGLRSNSIAILDILDAAGADWNTLYNQGGFTPLIYASLHCDLETIHWLIQRGQSVGQRTSNGVSVMHVAVQREQPKIARFLIEQGADPFLETAHDESPLIISLKSKHGIGTFKLMLQCYADAERSIAPKLMACMASIFDRQQPDAIEAMRALLPLAVDVPTEAEIKAFMEQPGNYARSPFRTLEKTLGSSTNRALFALLKAERISRSCQSTQQNRPVWQGHRGL